MRTVTLALALLVAPTLFVLVLRSLERTAAGGTALELSTDQLVDSSSLVVEGRVASATGVECARWIIYTDIELVVDRTFWGESRELRHFRLPGGVLPDGRGMLLPGVPLPQLHQRGIWFLSGSSPDGVRIPVGMGQGILRLLPPTGRERYLERDTRSLTLAPAGGAEVFDARGRTLVGYADTVAAIHAAVARRTEREAAQATSGGGR